MIKRDYYKNGQLWYEVPYHEGLQHGTAKYWWESGQLYLETPYHKGQRHGIKKYWYDNGQLEFEAPFHEGQRHGITRWWFRDGKLKSIRYHLYNNEVSEEEYRRHELIVKLSGL